MSETMTAKTYGYKKKKEKDKKPKDKYKDKDKDGGLDASCCTPGGGGTGADTKP